MQESIEYIPIVHKINKLEDDILKYNENPEFSINTTYPQFSLGFQHYIHQTKNKMEAIIPQFDGKKKVYYIVSHFERFVDEYDGDINNISKAYFDIDPKPNIISQHFYEMWELFFMFKLIDSDKTNFTSVHISEGDGSFTQATMYYRDKFSNKKSKNDKYVTMTLDELKEITNLDKDFINYYKKEKPLRLMDKIGHKEKVDLVTTNGVFKWENMNIQEQDSYKIIILQIINALNIQAKNGSLICKVYETFTDVMGKIIIILKSFYDNVYITKPFMSRRSDSEKFIVCEGYKGATKFDKLENIFDKIEKNKNKNLVSIFPDYELGKNFKATLINSNKIIANQQFETLNKMIVFVENQNFRGDDYTNYRNIQINASKFWLDKFFPDSKEFSTKKKNIESSIQKVINDNDEISKKSLEKLEF